MIPGAMEILGAVENENLVEVADGEVELEVEDDDVSPRPGWRRIKCGGGNCIFLLLDMDLKWF
jgi:hypothetical protein